MANTTMRLSEDTRASLIALALVLNAPSMTDVIRRSVALLEMVTDARSAGHLFLIRNPTTGEERQIVIL